MKSRIGLVVIALATATPAFAQSSDQPTTKTAPGISQSVPSGAKSVAAPADTSGQASANSVAPSQAQKAEKRAERNLAEAKITAQLNRQQLANAMRSATAGQTRSLSTPQMAAQPSDCSSEQPNCAPDARAPQ